MMLLSLPPQKFVVPTCKYYWWQGIKHIKWHGFYCHNIHAILYESLCTEYGEQKQQHNQRFLKYSEVKLIIRSSSSSGDDGGGGNISSSSSSG
jgi:hypothetical protein